MNGGNGRHPFKFSPGGSDAEGGGNRDGAGDSASEHFYYMHHLQQQQRQRQQEQEREKQRQEEQQQKQLKQQKQQQKQQQRKHDMQWKQEQQQIVWQQHQQWQKELERQEDAQRQQWREIQQKEEEEERQRQQEEQKRKQEEEQHLRQRYQQLFDPNIPSTSAQAAAWTSFDTMEKDLLGSTHAPIRCPVTSCQNIVSHTALMAHYMQDHKKELVIDPQELFRDMRVILVFDIGLLDFGKTVCLGALAYGGAADGTDKKLPAVLGICNYNCFLVDSNKHYGAHYPIVIMGAKLSWSAILGYQKRDERGCFPDINNPGEYVYVIWTIGAESKVPMYTTITVFNRAMTWSRSTIVKMHSFNRPQDPIGFMNKEVNHLWLTQADINMLMKNSSNSVHLEIVVNDYGGK